MADGTDIVADAGERLVADYGSTTQTSEQERPQELLEIYELIGRGPFQYLCWLLVALAAYTDYIEFTHNNVILPYLREEWHLTPTFANVIMASTLGSIAVFSVLFGKIADQYGRKTVVKWSMLVSLLSAIGKAASPNKWIFLVARFISGACIGANISSVICYSTEYAESKYRAYGITIFNLFASAGSVAVVGLASVVLKSVGWRWFIIITYTPTVPVLILILVLPDSPRFLCVSGRQDEAMAAVRFMAKLNRKELPENLQMTCFYDIDLGSYSMILDKEHRWKTITISAMQFGITFVHFGILTFLPLAFSSNLCGGFHLMDENYNILIKPEMLLKGVTITTSGTIFGVVTGLLFAQCIGRILPLRLISFASMVAMIGLLMNINCVYNMFFQIVSIISIVIEGFFESIIWIVIPESFPTNIRSTATGFINGWGNIGGVLGTFSVFYMFPGNPFLLLGIHLFFSFVTLVGTLVFKNETRYAVLKEI